MQLPISNGSMRCGQMGALQQLVEVGKGSKMVGYCPIPPIGLCEFPLPLPFWLWYLETSDLGGMTCAHKRGSKAASTNTKQRSRIFHFPLRLRVAVEAVQLFKRRELNSLVRAMRSSAPLCLVITLVAFYFLVPSNAIPLSSKAHISVQKLVLRCCILIWSDSFPLGCRSAETGALATCRWAGAMGQRKHS